MTIGDNSVSGEAAKQLKSCIDRIENLNDEIKGLQQDRKAIFDQAKLNGFDVKVMRRVIRERAMNREELDEFNLLTETYWGALEG